MIDGRTPQPLKMPMFGLFVLFQVVGWGAISLDSDHREWVNSWKWGVDAIASSVILTGPIAAGVTAYLYSTAAASSLPDLVATSPRRWQAWATMVLRVSALAVASVLMMLILWTFVALVWGLKFQPWQLIIVPYLCLVVVLHVLVGALCGILLRRAWAAPLAAVISFGLFLAAVTGPAPQVFVTGGITGSMVGERYRADATLTLVMMSLVLLLALAWLAASLLLRRGILVSAGALLVLIGCLAYVQERTPLDLEARLEPMKVDLSCEGRDPVVCVADEVPRPLPAAAGRMHEMAQILSAVGVTVPERWEESSPRANPNPRVGALILSTAGSAVRDEDIAYSLAMPADCPGFTEREPENSVMGRFHLGQWLLARDRPRTQWSPRAWYSTAESETWVRRTYAQLRACDLDAIRRPRR